MNSILFQLNEWAEVWSLLIPLAILIAYRPTHKLVRPVRIYLFVALFLNLAAIVLYAFHSYMPPFLDNNNIYYNLHSVARVLFFGWFIISIRPQKSMTPYKIGLVLYLGLILLNFVFLESPLYISSRLHAAEGLILIVLCSSFFLYTMQDESDTNWVKHSSFFVCVGIGLYEVTTLFIYLFFYQLSSAHKEFGEVTMTIRKMCFVLLCLALGSALYQMVKAGLAKSKTN
ncbi:MAG: hypothetical protein JNM19_05240 [Chitinophagaceae bacterium]|nr:hypothetical protein [Chitinophagaceae bacterium]